MADPIQEEIDKEEVEVMHEGEVHKEEMRQVELEVMTVKERGKEYFSWFSLEDKTVFLNMLLLE